MTTETIEEIKVEPTDLEQTNGQIQTKAFHFKVTHTNRPLMLVTALAPSSTTAREGIKQQFPDSLTQMTGYSDHIIQVNDNIVFDV